MYAFAMVTTSDRRLQVPQRVRVRFVPKLMLGLKQMPRELTARYWRRDIDGHLVSNRRGHDVQELPILGLDPRSSSCADRLERLLRDF